MDKTPLRPKPSTHGHLDRLDWQEDCQVRIAGWIFCEDVALEHIDVALGGQPWLFSVPLRERSDVIAAYRPLIGDRPHLAWSGFDVMAPPPEGVSARSPAVVTVTPHGEDGSTQDSFVTYSADGSAGAPQPPLHLQDRVGGSKNFAEVARQLTSMLLTCIGKWKSVFAAERILDWGCGCGRVIGQLMRLLPPQKLYGCDIDTEAIEWDQANLWGPSFTRIEPYPPTPYPDGSFDIVYGISVMTHLVEETQHEWLKELQRITRPDAVMALSVIGRDLRTTRMPASLQTAFAEKGFAAFVPDYSSMLADFSHPGYYQEAYHSIDYISSVWSEYFELLEYVETGHQDLILLRSRAQPGANLTMRSS